MQNVLLIWYIFNVFFYLFGILCYQIKDIDRKEGNNGIEINTDTTTSLHNFKVCALFFADDLKEIPFFCYFMEICHFAMIRIIVNI